jgi:hypothetical protein
VQRLADDVHRATVLNYESIVADGEADDLPSGDRAPDHAAVAACSDFRARLDAARGPCSSGPPRTAGRRPLRPESPFRQQIRVTRSLLHNISLFSPQPPRLAPFQTVCSVRTRAGTVVEADAMTDPMLVRRLALDLRNLADKTLELRGVVEDYRHDLVRTLEDDWCDPAELQAVHRQVQELWESMDRAEAKLRSGSRRMSPLLWLE